jgi:hypothetical protein
MGRYDMTPTADEDVEVSDIEDAINEDSFSSSSARKKKRNSKK